MADFPFGYREEALCNKNTKATKVNSNGETRRPNKLTLCNKIVHSNSKNLNTNVDSQTTGDSSREGVVECTYNMLLLDEEAIPVEGADLHLACPDEEGAVVSTSVNIGIQISIPSNNLTTKDQSENCWPHELHGIMRCSIDEDGFGSCIQDPWIADDILPCNRVEVPFDEESTSMPHQQHQSPTPPHNKDSSELRRTLTHSQSAITDSIVVKKLLRKSRYFDPGNVEDRTANPSARNRRKLCYLCGQLFHDAKKCPKRRACYTCKKKGHFAIDCPMNIPEGERICLRCGETGHEISSCTNDYCNDDLKKIHCYVCNELGHIYCGSNDDDLGMPTPFCYNCGESCHSGLLCPKPLVDQSGLKPPSICYKCGDEGHLARNCIKSSAFKQGASSELGGPETEDGDEHQNRKKARRSKSFKQGRARRRKLRGLVDCVAA